MRVLLVKMSSLGDVIHALPAVSDAARHGVTFDWVVEEAFAAIPRQHPAVRRVIPIGWRRWRRDLIASRAELAAFTGELREENYDLVLDAQGLMKSAVVTALARGQRRWGFDRASAREGAASLFYGRCVPVPKGLHAVDRQRRLFAGALNLPAPLGSGDFGIRTSVASVEKQCLFLHGTTWSSKHWPTAMWIDLARRLGSEGWTVSLPWGNEAERLRAVAIARDGNARVLESMDLAALLATIGGSALVIGVDSGLTHLAGALSVPTVVIYGSTDATLTGCRGDRVSNLSAQFDCAPCLERTCSYRGPALSWQGEVISPACYSRLSPEQVQAEARRVVEVIHVAR